MKRKPKAQKKVQSEPVKPELKKIKAKFKLPTKFEFNMSWVVLHPPPTSLDKCPRCEKAHKKFKPLKFKRPMAFYSPDGKQTARASHWFACPKTKEPVILFDRADMGTSIENMVVKQSAEDIAKQIDKEVLNDLSKSMKPLKEKPLKEKKGRWVKKTETRTQSVWQDDPQQTISVKATLSEPKVWVYDPNHPERLKLGTKAQRAKQQARVQAQEARAKKGKKR